MRLTIAIEGEDAATTVAPNTNMQAMTTTIEQWPIGNLVLYARNPRKNDAVVDRMCSSIREFGFKIPVLARSDGEVVDGHLRLKAARKLSSWRVATQLRFR